jgi:hypothetical protein
VDAAPESLIADFLEWVAREERPYAEVMERWRTSCPRLTVWEDAVDRGLVERKSAAGQAAAVAVTPSGQKFLRERAKSRNPAA